MENALIDIPKLFGNNVRKYRKAANLTQDELSKRLDISQKHLSIIENGVQFASPQLISKICAELDVEPSRLFCKNNEISDEQLGKLNAIIQNSLEIKLNPIKVLLLQLLNGR